MHDQRGGHRMRVQDMANREQCANCRKEIVSSNLRQLEVHAETHDQKLWPKEKCWPKEFPGA
jgi:hypothetical protein